MSVSRNKDGVPGWSGDPASWLEYRQAARLFVASTKYETRYTCGPRLAAELTGAARTAIAGKRSSWLSDPNGAEVLLSHLQAAIGEPALPEMGNYMRQYFRVLRRRRGESMTAFCVRHREEYERMCRSLARMVKEQQPRRDKVPRVQATGGTSRTASEADHTTQNGENLEGQRQAEGETGDNSETAAPSPAEDQWWHTSPWGWYGNWGWHYPAWSSYGWQSQPWRGSTASSQDMGEGEEDEMVEILPDAVLGWFLLEKSGLDTLEKSVIQGEIKGNFTLSGVENALRSHWNDDQVRKREGEAKQQANYQQDYESEEEEPLDEELAMFEEWPEEQKGWFQDAKAEEHHACVQLQQARRTLREARNRQHEIKMSRKFYRPGANTQNKGTGRGGGPVGMGTGARLPGHGPCFKCGAMGHKAAQCPQKESAQIVDEPEQAAEFTFFNEPKDAPENDCANTPEVLEVPEMALAAGELSVSPMVFMGHERKVSTEEAVRQGKAVIDGGATRTMGSLHALEMLEKQHQKQHGVSGVMHINPNEQPIFGFGNSQKSRCLSTCHMKLPSEQERQHEDPHLGSRRSTHPAERRQPPTHGRSDRL